VKPYGFDTFFFGRSLITDSISLMDTG